MEVSIIPIHIHFLLSCHWTPLRTIPLHLLYSHHQSSSTVVRALWAFPRLSDHRSLRQFSYITCPGSSPSSWLLIVFMATRCCKEGHGLIFQSSARKQVSDTTNPTNQPAPCNTPPSNVTVDLCQCSDTCYHCLHIFLYRQDSGLGQYCPFPAMVIKGTNTVIFISKI